MKPEQDLRRLLDSLARAKVVVAWPEDRLYVRDERISLWSPAQHLEHLSLVLVRVLRTIELLREGEDERILRQGRPSFAARMLLLTGWIPRGRGESPDEVIPDPRPVRHRLQTTLADATLQAARLEPVAAGLAAVEGRFPHPALGAFDAAEWMRFLHVHTKHHLAIIEDIDRKRAIGAPGDVAAGLEEEGPCEAGASSP